MTSHCSDENVHVLCMKCPPVTNSPLPLCCSVGKMVDAISNSWKDICTYYETEAYLSSIP